MSSPTFSVALMTVNSRQTRGLPPPELLVEGMAGETRRYHHVLSALVVPQPRLSQPISLPPVSQRKRRRRCNKKSPNDDMTWLVSRAQPHKQSFHMQIIFLRDRNQPILM